MQTATLYAQGKGHKCCRCGGLMIPDYFMDNLNDSGPLAITARRCIMCGAVIDAVILRNRQHRPSEPIERDRATKWSRKRLLADAMTHVS